MSHSKLQQPDLTELDLPAPSVLEAKQFTPERYVLDPSDSIEGARVRVSYENMLPDDSITAYWYQEGTSKADAPKLERANNQEFMDFSVAPSLISASFNETVTVRYAVEREGQTWLSPPRLVEILDISGLPTPAVVQATDEMLDLSKFSDDANCIVSPWHYMELGQHCWLWVVGVLEDGSTYSFPVLEAEPVTKGWIANGVTALLPRHELLKLADRSPIKVHFAVNFNGQVDKDSAKEYPFLELTLRRPLTEVRELFEEQEPRTFGVGGVVETPTMIITFEAGAGSAGIRSHGNTDYYSQQHFTMCFNADHQIPPQEHRFDFKHSLEYIKFGWAWKQRPATVAFYDPNDAVLAEFDFQDDLKTGFWVELTAPAGKTISSMRIVVRDYSFVDNFTMRYRD